MFEHAGIVFEMGAVDGKVFSCIVHERFDVAADDDRLIELGDLEIARAVGIKVGFAVEFAKVGDFGMDGAAELHGFSHRFFVEDGKAPGCAGA